VRSATIRFRPRPKRLDRESAAWPDPESPGRIESRDGGPVTRSANGSIAARAASRRAARGGVRPRAGDPGSRGDRLVQIGIPGGGFELAASEGSDAHELFDPASRRFIPGKDFDQRSGFFIAVRSDELANDVQLGETDTLQLIGGELADVAFNFLQSRGGTEHIP